MLERIRTAIRMELASLGVSDLTDFNETIMIRNGSYCGRKFRCQGHHVVWFAEENEIKFFGPSGDILRASSAEQCLASSESVQRRAA